MPQRGFVVVATFAMLLMSAGAATAQAGRSLDKCQKALQQGGAKYAAAVHKSVGNCLQKVAGELVKKDQPGADVGRAVNACVAQFYRLGRTDGSSTLAKAQARVLKACDPATTGHSADDVLGTGIAGVNHPLQAELRLDGLCGEFGGSAGSVAEVVDCVLAAAECQGRQQAAVGFPLAVEWLELVEAEVAAIAFPNLRQGEALLALQAARAAIDGTPAGDGLADIACGAGTVVNELTECADDLTVCDTDLTVCDADLTVCDANLTVCDTDLTVCADDLVVALECGNGVVDAGEDCDLGNLAGASCVSEGFTGGVLRCGAGCVYDTSECYAARFVDNANGTTTDNDTGLMWEKKVKLDSTTDLANLQDADNFYRWSGTCSVTTSKRCQPNAAASAACFAGVGGDTTGCDECTGGDGVCNVGSPGITIWQWLNDLNAANYGGHNDWRVPVRQELVTLVDYEAATNPVTFSALHGAACGAACTDVKDPACACTQSSNYWSASTRQADPTSAWLVNFNLGGVNTFGKTSNGYVRAVRSGS